MNHVRFSPPRLFLLLISLATLAVWVGCGGGGGGDGVVAQGSTGSGTGNGTGTSGSGTSSTGTSGGPTASAPPAPPPLAVPSRRVAEYVPGQVLVKMRESVRGKNGEPARELKVAARSLGLSVVRERKFASSGIEKVKITSGQTVAQAVETLSQLPEVEFAEPDYIVHADELLPNDSLFGDLWGLKNTGQSSGLAGADIQATEAWDITTGSPSVVVAVIDTGVNYSHPDLAANMWVNAAERNGQTGVDDDGNGYVDDIHGINAIDGSGDPMDDEGHGTHVAGTIGAVGNNNIGVTGVAFNTRVMALKFLNSSGTGTISDAIACLDYAVENGARVSNCSWGSGGLSFSLQGAINTAANSNHLVVAAAGNDGENTDQEPHYPSAYTSANIISVGYSNRNEQRGEFSNFGANSVDLFAPGQAIQSTVLGSGYGSSSGTSMATPHVSGVAALLLAHLGGNTPYATLKSRILDNVDELPAYSTRCVTGGRLNALLALDPSVTPTPSPSPTNTPSPSPSPTNTPSPTPSPSPTPGLQTIALDSGWNMLSFPVGQLTELTVASGAESELWVWDAVEQEYDQIPATASSANAGDGTSRGFWIFSDGAGSVSFRGTPVEARTLDLRQGWNLIGLPRESALTTQQLTLLDLSNQEEDFLSDSGCTAVPPQQLCLVFQYMFFWAGSYRDIDIAEGPSLPPRRAHWIHAGRASRLNFFPASND